MEKGFSLALAGGATKNHKGNFMAAISLWIGLSLVPQLLFVRIFITKILEKSLILVPGSRMVITTN